MSADENDSDISHPRASAVLFGQDEAEQALLESYRTGRIPHAWLIGGPPGIGKATLAYRMARFVLAHPDPGSPGVQKANSLAVDPECAAARRIAAQAHGNLLVLERGLNDKGKLRQEIAVDDVRAALPFFGSSAAEEGWRIAIVDSVDELNRSSANALLKVLEEPPARALLLLVSHSPGRVLPTIRSRCRRLTLQPLSVENVALAAAAASGLDEDDEKLREAAQAADGSVARSLDLLDGPSLALRQRVLDMLSALPDLDPRAMHALGEQLGPSEPQTLETFIDIVNDWLSARLKTMPQQPESLAPLALAWEKANRAVRDADAYNLDRKPLVFSVFGLLAEAARG